DGAAVPVHGAAGSGGTQLLRLRAGGPGAPGRGGLGLDGNHAVCRSRACISGGGHIARWHGVADDDDDRTVRGGGGGDGVAGAAGRAGGGDGVSLPPLPDPLPEGERALGELI